MTKIEGISKEFKEGIRSKMVKALEDLTLPFFGIDSRYGSMLN